MSPSPATHLRWDPADTQTVEGGPSASRRGAALDTADAAPTPAPGIDQSPNSLPLP